MVRNYQKKGQSATYLASIGANNSIRRLRGISANATVIYYQLPEMAKELERREWTEEQIQELEQRLKSLVIAADKVVLHLDMVKDAKAAAKKFAEQDSVEENSDG